MKPAPPLRDRLGICQWFHYEDDAALERAVMLMRQLGIRHLRTGISWADFLRPKGAQWYDRMLRALEEFDVLLSLWHTPPSLSEGNDCASPPRRLLDFADFVDVVISRYRHQFSHLELWNEPNNRYKWNFPVYDPEWRKFGEMIGCAAYWCRQRGVPTVLGGMIPVDHHWLRLMQQYGALPHIDVVAIHAFPGMWWEEQPNWDWHRDWNGWQGKVDQIRSHSGGRPIWVTETGIATWDLARGVTGKWELQKDCLNDAAAAPAERVYWYSLIDLDPARAAIEGYHVDENEYHMGLTTFAGKKKPAFDRFRRLLEGSLEAPAVRPRRRVPVPA